MQLSVPNRPGWGCTARTAHNQLKAEQALDDRDPGHPRTGPGASRPSLAHCRTARRAMTGSGSVRAMKMSLCNRRRGYPRTPSRADEQLEGRHCQARGARDCEGALINQWAGSNCSDAAEHQATDPALDVATTKQDHRRDVTADDRAHGGSVPPDMAVVTLWEGRVCRTKLPRAPSWSGMHRPDSAVTSGRVPRTGWISQSTQERLHGVRHLYNGSSGTFLPVKEADSDGNSQVR